MSGSGRPTAAGSCGESPGHPDGRRLTPDQAPSFAGHKERPEGTTRTLDAIAGISDSSGTRTMMGDRGSPRQPPFSTTSPEVHAVIHIASTVRGSGTVLGAVDAEA
jgi:hypothetical protein